MWRSFIRANLAYAIGSVATGAASLLLVPYLVNALSTEEFGAWALFEITIVLLNIVILAGLDVGLMREYWFLEDEAKRAGLAGTILIIVILWGAILVAGATVLLTTSIQISLPGTPYTLIWVLMIALAEAIFSLLLTLLRIREKAALFVALSVGRLVLFLVMAIALVHSGYGLTGALVGRFFATVLGMCIAAISTARYINVRIDRDVQWRAIRYGLPLLPTNVASFILFASDRYVLQYTSTLQTIAIYTFAYKLATLLDILITRPFSADWAPRRFKIATMENAPLRYAQILVLYLFAAMVFGLLVMAATPTLYAWFAPPVYQAGMAAVPIILLAYLVYGLSYPLNVGIMLKDQTKYLPLIGWLAAGICLALNFLWIPAYGMIGAAWATVAAYAVWTAGIAWLSLRFYPIPYSIRQISSIVMAGAAGYGGLWVINEMSLVPNNLVALAFNLIWIASVTSASGYWLWRSK